MKGGFGLENNIAALRKKKGLSQAELADRVGITNWWLCNIETGRRQPGLQLVLRLAKELDVTPNDIFLN